jgi:hypothetical protein
MQLEDLDLSLVYASPPHHSTLDGDYQGCRLTSRYLVASATNKYIGSLHYLVAALANNIYLS